MQSETVAQRKREPFESTEDENANAEMQRIGAPHLLETSVLRNADERHVNPALTV